MGHWQYRALLGLAAVAIVGWYALGLALVWPALDTMVLSAGSAALLEGASWALLAVALYVNAAWLLFRCTRRTPFDGRLSDGEWRSDVLLRLMMAIALFTALITLLLVDTDGDSSWLDVEVADRRLLTRLTPFEALLAPLVLAPLFVALFLFAAIGRARGNVIKRRAL